MTSKKIIIFYYLIKYENIIWKQIIKTVFLRTVQTDRQWNPAEVKVKQYPGTRLGCCWHEYITAPSVPNVNWLVLGNCTRTLSLPSFIYRHTWPQTCCGKTTPNTKKRNAPHLLAWRFAGFFYESTYVTAIKCRWRFHAIYIFRMDFFKRNENIYGNDIFGIRP